MSSIRERGWFAIGEAALAAGVAIWLWNYAALRFDVPLPLATPEWIPLNPLLLPLVAVAAAIVWVDPASAPLRRWLQSPRGAACWLVLCLAGASLGFYVFALSDAERAAKLLETGKISALGRALLRRDMGFGLLLLHSLWIGLAPLRARKLREQKEESLERTAAILSLSIFAGLFSLSTSVVSDSEWMTLVGIGVAAVVASLLWPAVPGPASPHRAALAVAIALYVLVMSFLSVRKLDVYAGNGDFPVYLQPLWTALHGRFFELNWSYTPPFTSISWFGEHFDVIYFLLLPIYWLAPSPRVFVVLQALVVGLAAWPLSVLARERLRDPALGAAFGFAFLANPLVARALVFDFHAEALEPLLIFSTFLFLQRRQIAASIVCSLLLLSCKEDAALYLVAFGAYFFLAERWRRGGSVLVLAGVAWLVFAVGVAIPHFHPGSVGYDTFQQRYPRLGKSAGEALANVLRHPLLPLSLLFDEAARKNWVRLVFPLAGLPLVHWTGWLLIVFPTLEMFLSQFRQMRGLWLHYPLFVSPLYFLAAVVTLERLGRRFAPAFGQVRRRLPMLLVLLGVLFHARFNPVPPGTGTFNRFYNNTGPLGPGFRAAAYHVNDHDRAIRGFLDRFVPEGEPLATDHRFSHDVSNRFVLRMLPEVRDVDLVFLDVRPPSLLVIGRALPDVKRRILPLLAEGAFGVERYEDGLVLLRRGFSTSENLAVARDLVGFFEAEGQRPESGVDDLDGEARNKRARFVGPEEIAGRVVLRSDAQTFPAGRVSVAIRARCERAAGAEAVLRAEIADARDGRIESRRVFSGSDFADGSGYRDLVIESDHPQAGPLVLDLRYEGHGELAVDHFRWRSEALSWSDLQRNLDSQ